MRLVHRWNAGILPIMLMVFCMAGFAAELDQKTAVGDKGNSVCLEVCLPDSGMTGTTICPPPGGHDIPRDDIVLLQGRSSARPDCAPTWCRCWLI